jgi:hypothetical protein
VAGIRNAPFTWHTVCFRSDGSVINAPQPEPQLHGETQMIALDNLTEERQLTREEMAAARGGIWGHVLAGAAVATWAYLQATDYDIVTDEVKNAGSNAG